MWSGAAIGVIVVVTYRHEPNCLTQNVSLWQILKNSTKRAPINESITRKGQKTVPSVNLAHLGLFVLSKKTLGGLGQLSRVIAVVWVEEIEVGCRRLSSMVVLRAGGGLAVEYGSGGWISCA